MGTEGYAETYAASSEDPEKFWLHAAALVDWDVAPAKALDDSRPPFYRWFPDGMVNTSFNALDRHVLAGHGNRAALVYDSAMLGLARTYTYAELLAEVETFAGVLHGQGIRAGDRVVIYLPMIPEAVIAMLATARLGAVHSVVFGGFAAAELAARIDDAKPDAVITASGGLEPKRRVEYLPAVAEALETAKHRVRGVVVAAREGFAHTVSEFEGAGGAHWADWAHLAADAQPHGPVSVAATDPLYILYTSGTTGSPKGVVRDNGSHAVALAWSMANIYDAGPGQVMWTASDVGWVVGHSYIVYGPLIAGATTVLYEGKPVGTPDAGAFWRVAAEHSVEVLFTAPTALRAIRRADPDLALAAGHDLSKLRTLFAAGERLDPETFRWISGGLGIPVVDHWWQTETGWAICANPMGLDPQPLKAGSPTFPVPGFRLRVVDGTGTEVSAGTEGNIVLDLPLPPGTLATLWGSDERYRASYLEAFKGSYATGDSGYVDEDGYVFVMGRTDDVINVAGHRLSTGAIEQAVAKHPDVAECAVIGVRDSLKGQRPCGYVVLKAGSAATEADIQAALADLVRQQIGPVADFRDVRVVDGLPKTRSGKILRKTMRQIADGEEFSVPSTIEDRSVLDALVPLLRPAVQRGL
ncbi:AMP-binding protein [Arthrobacter sp. Sa2BUA2]|uniref:AMP-binding protein n=1 Tax=Arthrobacter pullicola TaxID=2762224 RepID=A0ABR8YKY9_9MICC|nr:AMP-binding protein [Arthrobacter pullicola]MBD8044912.1 AMP-binding protein [Arthrobacter pullicola]